MIEVGQAEAGELPALQEIERCASRLFRTHPQTARLELSMTPESRFVRAQAAGLLWVARSGREPIGFALVEDFGTGLHLEELDVAPEHGRQGIGRTLVRTVCEFAASRGLPVTLCTFSEVPWNAPFYERMGFVRLSPGDLSPALRERVREEAERGLSPDLRTAMLLDVSVVLREVREEDLPVLFEHQADPEAARMAAFPSRDLDAFMAHWAKIMQNGAVIKETILLDGRVVGNVVSFDRDGRREVGYWVGRDCWGRGIATRALAEFLKVETTRPLHAFVAKHNAASIRVLQKCGFRIHGEGKGPAFPGLEDVEDFYFILEADRASEMGHADQTRLG